MKRQWRHDSICKIMGKDTETSAAMALIMPETDQLLSWYFESVNPTKYYIRTKNNVQSVSCLLCIQVIKPQIIQKP